MKNILARAASKVLEDFAVSGLFAFDFDGTLAPLVRERAQAQMRATTRKLLQKLAQVAPCVVLSGRSLADLSRRMGGIDVAVLAGLHGEEFSLSKLSGPKERQRQHQTLVRSWRKILAQELTERAGIDVEDKGQGLALHYRKCLDKAAARQDVEKVALRLPRARLIFGKDVVDCLPQDASDKGKALQQLMRALHYERALFMGDDTTDEDVFSLPQGRKLLTIRVGRSARSHAAYYVPTQKDVDELLRRILAVLKTRVSNSPR